MKQESEENDEGTPLVNLINLIIFLKVIKLQSKSMYLGFNQHKTTTA